MPWPMSATCALCSAAAIAAENPAEPAPTTARSNLLLPFFRTQHSFMVGGLVESHRITARSRRRAAAVKADGNQSKADQQGWDQHVIGLGEPCRQPKRAKHDGQQ